MNTTRPSRSPTRFGDPRKRDAGERVADEHDVGEFASHDLGCDRVGEVGDRHRKQVGGTRPPTREVDRDDLTVEERNERRPARTAEASTVDENEWHRYFLSPPVRSRVDVVVGLVSEVRPVRWLDHAEISFSDASARELPTPETTPGLARARGAVPRVRE